MAASAAAAPFAGLQARSQTCAYYWCLRLTGAATSASALPPTTLQFPTTLEKGLSKLISLKDSFGGMLSGVSRMMGAGGPGGEDMIDQMLGKVEQLKVRCSAVRSGSAQGET